MSILPALLAQCSQWQWFLALPDVDISRTSVPTLNRLATLTRTRRRPAPVRCRR